MKNVSKKKKKSLNRSTEITTTKIKVKQKIHKNE